MVSGRRNRLPHQTTKELLFCLFLLLLAYANLELHGFRILVRFVIVPGYGIGQVGVDVGAHREDRHQGVGLVAGWAERPETLHIRD